MTTAAMTDEALWASWYGVQYATKFNVEWRDRIPLLRSILTLTGARSILDVGTNLGWNLRAFREIDNTLTLKGVDVNGWAVMGAAAMDLDVVGMDAREVGDKFPEGFDLVMTSGVLIHMHGEALDAAMRSIVKASRKWVLAIEYPAMEETAVGVIDGTPRTWARPFWKLYERLGLELEQSGFEMPEYPNCHAWLMRKP